MRVGNKSPEPIRCHGNTNRETTYGDFGDNLVGRAVDHGNVIGVSVGDKRDWAKAEDAKANAKIVNSKARRYVFIVKDVGLTRALFLTRARRWTQRCVGVIYWSLKKLPELPAYGRTAISVFLSTAQERLP